MREMYLVNGIPLRCGHCRGSFFRRRSAQLNTPGMTFFDLEWLNKSAEDFVCTKCQHLEWFLDPKVEDEPIDGPPDRRRGT
ncbi:MAG: DNA-binding protein [Verrucomicrobiae bacterium]|nr:DNA-binding protein [Verrucomicrobiae bacterium]